MPFEKIYSQQLRTFPPELRDSSIQYHELKKLIGLLVIELNDLGLSPETLRDAISRVESTQDLKKKKSIPLMGIVPDRHSTTLAKRSEERLVSAECPMRSSTPEVNVVRLRGAAYSKVLYEVISESGKSFPQLRLYITTAALSEARSETPSDEKNSMESVRCRVGGGSILGTVNPISTLSAKAPDRGIHDHDRERATSIPHAAVTDSEPVVPATKTIREVVIPLVHDAEFFDLLEGNIQTLTAQMEKIHSEFLKSLRGLVEMIADTCQPASVAGNYRPYSSVSTHPGTVEVKVKHMKSDLYAWRQIFELFVEAQVFGHANEGSKVEWAIEESEKRLNAFTDKVASQWLADNGRMGGKRRKGRDRSIKEQAKRFKHKRSADALRIFIKLNFLILNIRKAFQANIEAIQKLVKKHTEHTALPLTCSFSENANVFSIGHLHQSSCAPILGLIHPRLFIQEITDKLFPIIPNLDDYSCAICTNLAFKPIRLSCSHLFCVRCLVKMQKRGEGNCPMCRAPCVLRANAANVDWGLLNFMEDWFPLEAREKLRANEKEVVNEQLAEWQADEAHCSIM